MTKKYNSFEHWSHWLRKDPLKDLYLTQIKRIEELADKAFESHPSKDEIMEKIGYCIKIKNNPKNDSKMEYNFYPTLSFMVRTRADRQTIELDDLLRDFFTLLRIPVEPYYLGGDGIVGIPPGFKLTLKSLSIALLTKQEAEEQLEKFRKTMLEDSLPLCFVFQDKDSKAFKIAYERRRSVNRERDNGTEIALTRGNGKCDFSQAFSGKDRFINCCCRDVESLLLIREIISHPKTLYREEEILEIAESWFNGDARKDQILVRLKGGFPSGYQREYELLTEITENFFKKKELFVGLPLPVQTVFDDDGTHIEI